MLQSVKRALSIDPDHPWLHQCLVRFFKGGKAQFLVLLLRSEHFFASAVTTVSHLLSSFSFGEQGTAGHGQDGAEAGNHPAVWRQQR